MIKITVVLLMMNFVLFSQQNASKIIFAVNDGDLKMVTILLDKGENPNRQNSQMKSLLYLATENNNFEMVDLLLNKGALVDFPFDNDNRIKEQEGFDVIDPTPILYAGAHGQTKIMERLLKEIPDLEIRNHYGGNALIPAAEKGHYATAKLLLEKTDIDVDFINFLGWTALLEVVILSKNKEMQIKMAKLLLDHGAKATIKDKDGVDALMHAKKSNNKALIKLIESY